jgi:cytosine/adenosine deaminase-related metal-dependent hydrolase
MNVGSPGETSPDFDIFIEGGTVITMDDEMRVFEGDVLIRDGRIHALGKRLKPKPGARTVNAKGCFVLPGLIQSHVHLCQALFRGFAEDLDLLSWLKKRIWPLEAAHDEASLRASARIGLAELLLGGTTSALDMGTVHHTDVIFEVAERAGFRLTSGKALMDAGRDRPKGLRETTRRSLEESDRLADAWHDNGLLRYAYAPRFILSCSEEALRGTVERARQRGCLIHTHSSESPGEIEAVRRITGMENIEALHELGLTGPDVALAHCVHLSDAERRILKKTDTRVVHCPSTNLKLASGVAPVPELLKLGLTIGIGADGAPCNNRLSAFNEMRLAALLQKPRVAVDALSAQQTLHLATRGGAKVLGIDDQVGSLEKGKRADVIVVDGNRPHLRPRADPYTTLVYAAEANDVRDVFIDGVWRVREHRVIGVDFGELMEDAEAQLDGCLKRAGLDLR